MAVWFNRSLVDFASTKSTHSVILQTCLSTGKLSKRHRVNPSSWQNNLNLKTSTDIRKNGKISKAVAP